MIIVKNISKCYNDKPVLSNFSYTIKAGVFCAITGDSGSGKTTLLNIIGGLETPDKGTVSIDGIDSFKPKDKMMFYREKAGFLFQNYALLEDKTVLDNLKIALAYRTLKSKKDAICDVISQFGLTDDVLEKKVYQLSGGEQQRIALARLIIKNPKYIFADEPTGNLDTKNRDIVFNHLIELNEKGKTVIIVTHDKELIAKVKNVVYL